MATILALQANPSGTAVLRLNHEIREVRARLRAAGARHVAVQLYGALRPEDLQQLLLDCNPDIVHYSGHATEHGELLLEDDRGGGRAVPAEALAGVFRALRGRIRCVVLNSCYSAAQAAAIAEHIPYVVGMRSQVSDQAAIAFAAAFYQGLAFGRSVPDSFELGRLEVAMLGVGDEYAPRLHTGDGANAAPLLAAPTSAVTIPSVVAQFVLDKAGRPVASGKPDLRAYEIEFRIEDAPPGALVCVYQMHDPWEDSIPDGDKFDEVANDGDGFVTARVFYGDVYVRATLWTESAGWACVRRASAALRAHYGDAPRPAIAKAIALFERQ